MLKYVGNSSLPGVPARDLTAEEVRKHGKTRLIMSGLYVEIRRQAETSAELSRTPVEAKMQIPKYDNKALQPEKEDKAKE